MSNLVKLSCSEQCKCVNLDGATHCHQLLLLYGLLFLLLKNYNLLLLLRRSRKAKKKKSESNAHEIIIAIPR